MNQRVFRTRLIIIFFGFILLFLILIGNLIRIQVFDRKKWQEIAYKQYYRGDEIIGKRGKILTLNGEEIAYDMESYSLVLDPTLIDPTRIEDVAKIFGEILDSDVERINENIEQKAESKRKYLKIADEVLKFKKDDILKELEKSGIKNNGIFFMESTKRVYPKGSHFKYLTGFLNSNKEGMYGIEKQFNEYLEPEKGYQKKYVSTYIVFDLPVGKKKEVVEPQDGKNIVLTIDYVMQHILYDELASVFEETESEWATGIIVEPGSGKVKAMVSLPESKNNTGVRNNVIYNQYEPGSVMKPLVMAMALDKGLVKEDELFYSKGKISIYNATINDHDDKTVGYLTLKDIISKSSNVGMVQVGQRFDRPTFYEYLKKFGFGERTGIELPGERKVRLRHFKKWSGVSIATMTFGQGIAATPLQMAMAFSATVNGGMLKKPLIIERIEDENGKILKEYFPENVHRVMSEKTSKFMKELMQDVVENGTAKNVKIDGYEFGGKTGTSQKSGGKSGYAKGKYIASFAGFFPVDNPKYLCLIVVDEPKGGKYYGSQVAAPVFKNVMDRIIKYKEIPPGNVDTKTITLNDVEEVSEAKVITDLETVPDFVGMSKREVLNNLGESKLEVIIKGRGKVIRQSPKPGKQMSKVGKLYLVLEEN